MLGNATGRTHAATGLLWGSTRVDWGDVQECQVRHGLSASMNGLNHLGLR